MVKIERNKNIRDRGNAAWCVRKHCGGALRHATETNQKLGRNSSNRNNRIKLDKPTLDEANAIIFDLDQIEYHIQTEVLPQVQKKSTKAKLRRIDRKARKIRQNIAKTGIIFYDNKNVDDDAMIVIEESVGELKDLLREIDSTASHIMTQEQISCDKCVEDLVGVDGLKSMKTKQKAKEKAKKKKNRFHLFGKKKGKKRRK